MRSLGTKAISETVVPEALAATGVEPARRDQVQVRLGVMSELNKAWIGALVSGLTTAISMASQLHIGTATPDQWFQLGIFSLGSAVAALSGVYLIPNKPKVQ